MIASPITLAALTFLAIIILSGAQVTVPYAQAGTGETTIQPWLHGFTPLAGHGVRMAWSPNGSIALVFSQEIRGDWMTFLAIADREGNVSWGVYYHDATIHGVSWSPDGSMLAVAVNSDELRLYVYYANGSLAWNDLVFDGKLRDVAWSPAGDRLALLTNTNLIIYDTTGERVVEKGIPIWSRAMEWSPTGDGIAVTADLNPGFALYIFSGDGSLKANISTTSAYIKFSWSPTGDRIAYTADLSLHIVDGDGGEILEKVINMSSNIVRWSPDGDMIAVLGYTIYSDNLTLAVFDQDGNMEWNTSLGEAKPRDLQWRPDSSMIAVSTNVSLAVYTSDGNHLWTAGNASYSRISWSPQGDILVASVKIGDPGLGENAGFTAYTPEGAEAWSLTGPPVVPYIVSNCPGRGIIVSDTEKIYLVGADGLEWMNRPYPGFRHWFLDEVRCTTDGERVAALVSYYDDWANDYIDVYVYDTSDGALVWNKTRIEGILSPANVNLAWSPRGDLLVLTTNDRIIAFTGDGDAAWSIDGYGGEVSWSPDGTMIAVESEDGIYIISPEGEILANTTLELNTTLITVDDLKWSPTGEKLAASSWWDNVVFILSQDGRIEKMIPQPSGVRDIAWSPQGDILAVSLGNDELHVYNSGGDEIFYRDFEERIDDMKWLQAGGTPLLAVVSGDIVTLISQDNHTVATIDPPLPEAWTIVEAGEDTIAVIGPGGIAYYKLTRPPTHEGGEAPDISTPPGNQTPETPSSEPEGGDDGTADAGEGGEAYLAVLAGLAATVIVIAALLLYKLRR